MIRSLRLSKRQTVGSLSYRLSIRDKMIGSCKVEYKRQDDRVLLVSMVRVYHSLGHFACAAQLTLGCANHKLAGYIWVTPFLYRQVHGVLYLDSASIMLWYVHNYLGDDIRSISGVIIMMTQLTSSCSEPQFMCIGFHCQVLFELQDDWFLSPPQFGSILHVQHNHLLAVLVTGWFVIPATVLLCRQVHGVAPLQCKYIALCGLCIMISAACGYLHVQHNQL